MIVKMKRITLIGPYLNKEKVLDLLQKAGVVDIIEKEMESIPQIAEMVVLEKIQKALDILKSYEEEFSEKKEDFISSNKDFNLKSIDAESIADMVIKNNNDIEMMTNNISNLEKAISTQELWGNFDYNEIKKLKNDGIIYIQFWSSSSFKRIKFEEGQVPIIVNKTKKETYFITISKKPYEMIDNSTEMTFYHSVEDLKSALEDSKVSIKENKVKLYNITNIAKDNLEAALIEYTNKTEFQKAKLNLNNEIEGSVYTLEGWCPVSELAKLDNTLAKQSVHLIIEDPTREDEIPITIKNRAFTKLFEPITKLYSLPDYFELDLTALFAPLFWLFFGLCLGDAGWGAIILIGAIIGFFKAKKQTRPLLVLGMFFAVMTIIIGLITGTVLGFSTREVPVLKELIVIKDAQQQQMVLFYLSLLLGVFQIYLGLIANTINLMKYESFISGLYPIGKMIFLAGIFIIIAPMVEPTFPKVPSLIVNILLIVGLVMILIFNSTGNIFKRIGNGLWELYNIVTGFFGDVLSYIRLFALGLSGSILGLVINQIGANILKGISVPILNYVIYFIFLAILHLLMLLLSALGSFVHPLRLTFVEFYKNAGFKGSAKVYRPFALKVVAREKAS